MLLTMDEEPIAIPKHCSCKICNFQTKFQRSNKTVNDKFVLVCKHVRLQSRFNDFQLFLTISVIKLVRSKLIIIYFRRGLHSLFHFTNLFFWYQIFLCRFLRFFAIHSYSYSWCHWYATFVYKCRINAVTYCANFRFSFE